MDAARVEQPTVVNVQTVVAPADRLGPEHRQPEIPAAECPEDQCLPISHVSSGKVILSKERVT
ncbi:hypothetical protein GCM10010466_33680 [Planomonospora alba]|uniref:Uncharacterized protein n=1 Tax=Planomonospora alba TaxID=161354 RepID=A0ABP6N8E7_9ACTN